MMNIYKGVFNVQIVAVTDEDRAWIRQFVKEHWGSAAIVSRGMIHDTAMLDGFIALEGAERLGLVTYHLAGDACEIVTLDSLAEGHGVASALVAAVRDAARANGWRRIWLVTTNDNLRALGWYQRYGFILAALHPNAIAEARLLKPEIPATGQDGIPIRDEIELELPV
jgi:ribosomal protein S18 acetylase RimI-like enzyme